MRGLSQLVALMLASAPAFGQTGQIDLPSVPADAVLILNGGNKTIVFYVSQDKVNLARFSLDSGERQLIQTGGTPRVFGTVKTGATRIDRVLEAKKRYRLFLDEEQGVWDFVEITPR